MTKIRNKGENQSLDCFNFMRHGMKLELTLELILKNLALDSEKGF